MSNRRKFPITSLKSALLASAPGALEELGASLLGWLLGIRVYVASSGFQYGGDAGSAGAHRRELRIECKRYASTTRLDHRALLGEIDEALHATPTLEAWILISTRAISQTTRDKLKAQSERTGLPVIIFDWSVPADGVPDLARLCTAAPELIERHYGRAAAEAARAIPACKIAVDRLREGLQPWRIGFEALAAMARAQIRTIWTSVPESRAALHQNVAGATQPDLIARQAVHQQTQQWWSGVKEPPLVVLGREGVGKTWALVHWIVENLDALPITLVIPADAWVALKELTDSSVVNFLAHRLQELARARVDSYWQKRVLSLLERPVSEGASLLLLIDGLNQEPKFEWLKLLQVLQAKAFRGRVRVVLTTQTHFFEDELSGLGYLALPCVRLAVEPYDLSAGGEFDQMLAQHGIARSELSDKVIALARNARMFPLAVKYRADAALSRDATVNRLLWAYSFDELRMREGRAFTETEWIHWLKDRARSYLEDARKTGRLEPQAFTPRALSDTAAFANRDAKETTRRLSEIIEGEWMEPAPGDPGAFRLKDHTLALGLAVALLAHLESVGEAQVESELSRWIEPIAASERTADVLAAALSIGPNRGIAITSAIVGALLNSQNSQPEHHQEVVAMAAMLIEPLLVALESSQGRWRVSGRQSALAALASIPVDNVSGWQVITERIVGWMAEVRCPSPAEKQQADEETRVRSARLIEVLGTDAPGTIERLGIPVRARPWTQNELTNEVQAILQGRPLVPWIRIFVAASLACVIDPRNTAAWEGLFWLSQLNPVDRAQMNAGVIAQAERLERDEFGGSGSAELRQRVAARLLHLTGEETQQARGYALRPKRGEHSYESNYLPDPLRSWLTLERRHAEAILADETVLLLPRLQRAHVYLADPSLQAPPALVHTLEHTAELFDVSFLNSEEPNTQAEMQFREFRVAAARFAPEALEWVVTKLLDDMKTRAGRARLRATWRAAEHLLLVGPREAQSMKQLRANKSTPPDRDELYLTCVLLQLEFLHASPQQQLDLMIQEHLEDIPLTLLACSDPLPSEELDYYLSTQDLEDPRTVEIVLSYLAQHGIPLSDASFQRLLPYAFAERWRAQRPLAFIALHSANAAAFGQELKAREWRSAPHQSRLEQEHGSCALLAALSGQGLDESWLRAIVPWRLLRLARDTGSVRDAQYAAQAIHTALNVPLFEPERPPVDVYLDATDPRVPVSLRAQAPTDPAAQLERAFDIELQVRAEQDATELGRRWLDSARAAGASLYTALFTVQDVRVLLQHCPAEIDAWLDGMEARTPAFIRRVNMSAGLFLTLCECLLERQPDRGVQLWHCLTAVLRVKITGIAGIDEFMHVAFRAPPSAPAEQLRLQLYSLGTASTDEAYFTLTVCALANGQTHWLEERARLDERSGESWRAWRALMLRGFFECPAVDQLQWFEGPVVTGWAALRQRASYWRNRHALARYWWTRFVQAPTAQSAYAAWQVFLSCADRRAWVFIAQEGALDADLEPLGRLKRLHLLLNESALERAMRDGEKNGNAALQEGQLMGWTSPAQWLNLRAVDDAP
jgi:hypothetical protein